MSPSTKKTLVVLGATGTQGSSVLRYFLSSPDILAQWNLRGISRNPNSPASIELASQGVEMVKAELSDPTSLTKAFNSATAIFAVTDFWTTVRDPTAQSTATERGFPDIFQYARHVEETWGNNVALAASDASVLSTLQHFIFSALPPVEKLTKSKFKHVLHFDSKANIIINIRTNFSSLWSRTSQILIGHYNSNILPPNFFCPKYNPSTRQYEMTAPMHATKDLVPYIDTPNSTGHFVASLILDEPIGAILIAFDEMLSRESTCEIIASVTGKPVVFIQKSTQEVADEDPEMGLETAESGAWCGEFGFFGEKVDGGEAWLGGKQGAGDWKGSLTWPEELKVMRGRRVGLEEWIGGQDWSGLNEE